MIGSKKTIIPIRMLFWIKAFSNVKISVNLIKQSVRIISTYILVYYNVELIQIEIY